MINRSSQSCPKLIIQLAMHIYNRLLLSEYIILCRVGSPTIVQRARLSAPILSHLLLGRQGLLVRIHSLIVTHIILTTITRMRPFYNRLPVGSRSRLSSYSGVTRELQLHIFAYVPKEDHFWI